MLVNGRKSTSIDDISALGRTRTMYLTCEAMHICHLLCSNKASAVCATSKNERRLTFFL